ncbi:RagB/SusD family nutrient uptake outer membrane protein [Adhaeribacter aquaticus]|uniref:RagB/SusD family nutrient uptake outer membrane protein n=1 Tax=Adhaeribacter aquaticus TaxID=299567 RepID=UPI00047A74D3|nr:RagB/SusD family nutrient uptake outer membrane protein [Adhaeribacter aquaticus]
MRKIYISACLLGALLLTNCHDELDKTNPNFVTTENYFKTAGELQLATNSIYSVIASNNLVAREWFFTHVLRSPDYASGGAQLEAPRAQILNGGTTPDNGLLNAIWSNLYIVIHRANTVIANASNVTDNATLRDATVAEAQFLRAWAYYELVNFFGAVPLYTEPVAAVDAFKPRTAVADIYKLIEADLKAAQTGLPATRSGDNLGRVTSGAATFLLGKSYMQQGVAMYPQAKTELTKLVGRYSLVSNYSDNFREETEYNAESIWEVGFQGRSDNGYNWGAEGNGATAARASVRNQEINPISWRNLIPSNEYLNEFETTAKGSPKTDPRLDYSVYFPVKGDKLASAADLGIGITGDQFGPASNRQDMTEALQGGAGTSIINGTPIKVSWEKYTNLYKSAEGFQPAGINTRVMRYAEVLLLLAEIENEQGNQTAALGYLNQLRNRPSVMMPTYPNALYPASTKEQVFAAIRHENQVERGGEEGRDFDVFRWLKQGKIANPFKTYTFNPARDFVLPIPQDEISRNPQLGSGGIDRQNPNY